jgi:hypothetical protein
MKKVIGSFVRTALAVVTLAGSQFAMADIGAGSQVKFADGPGSGTGGAFNVSVVAGAGLGESFQSFCLEKTEYLDFSSTFYVKSVTGATTSAGTPDPLGDQAAWLFTQFTTNANSFFGSNLGAVGNTALQQAIWTLEGEQLSTSNALANTYINLANTATAGVNGWKNNGSVQVMNLFYDANYSRHAQDQIYMVSSVPEPGTYGMMLIGAGLIGTIAARRRKNKNA